MFIGFIDFFFNEYHDKIESFDENNIYQAETLEKAGLGAYYTDHGVGVYPQAAAGYGTPYRNDDRHHYA